MRKKKSKVMKSKLVAAWYKERTAWVERRNRCYEDWGVPYLYPSPGPMSKRLISMYAKVAIKTKKTK